MKIFKILVVVNVNNNLKILKVAVEVGFEDIGSGSNIESAKLDLRNGLKELIFETTSEYQNIVSFNIDEVVVDSDGSDNGN